MYRFRNTTFLFVWPTFICLTASESYINLMSFSRHSFDAGNLYRTILHHVGYFTSKQCKTMYIFRKYRLNC
uniref:Secreted protein n=1 Tax=Setaria viridis TaxID=4556 RepID=A0A4U6W1S2_SETVI|nr:hypothetical protein SEVIR_2G306050v2 [Setaria viridis]